MNTKEKNEQTLKDTMGMIKGFIYASKAEGTLKDYKKIEFALIDEDGEVTTIKLNIEIQTKLYNNIIPF